MSVIAGNNRQTRQQKLAQALRVDSVRASAAAGSGHPTSSMSAADLMAVLLEEHLRLDFNNPEDPFRDHLIFSKGHASPLYYAMLKAVGLIDDAELHSYRRLNSRLEGHPTPRIPPTDVATGSLGQGLPVGVGVALAGRDLDRLPYRVWVLCGDSEMAEGSIWEAIQHAGWSRLANLTAIIDVNRLGQTRETMLGWDLDAYAVRIRAFGWHTIQIDGHDLNQIETAYREVTEITDRPTAIIAKTHKGRGVKAVENLSGKHGKPLDDPAAAISELGGRQDIHVEVNEPDRSGSPHRFPTREASPPSWDPGEQVATRKAYGEALALLADRRSDVVALDGEVSNSTFAGAFAERHPERYFEMFIAEQQMLAAAVGFQARGWVPFASSFAAFLSRAYDFIRMAAISRADLCLCGSHAGVSIGEDGPSQMALEDLAALRAVHGSTVLSPSDANQVPELLEQMAAAPGISYMRTLRPGTTVRTPPGEPVQIGGSRRVQGGAGPHDVTIIATGVCVDQAVAAADSLELDGVTTAVLDCYSIKPIDAAALTHAANTSRLLISVEDHWPEGGLGDAALTELAAMPRRPPLIKLAVNDMPVSGSKDELLHAYGIDAAAIVTTARQALDGVAKR
ncbi:MAG: transketolase [Solirubrobacterales bacterium]|nr:transketolase [Solirubrobacterales bacterium]